MTRWPFPPGTGRSVSGLTPSIRLGPGWGGGPGGSGASAHCFPPRPFLVLPPVKATVPRDRGPSPLQGRACGGGGCAGSWPAASPHFLPLAVIPGGTERLEEQETTPPCSPGSPLQGDWSVGAGGEAQSGVHDRLSGPTGMRGGAARRGGAGASLPGLSPHLRRCVPGTQQTPDRCLLGVFGESLQQLTFVETGRTCNQGDVKI